MQTLLKTLLIAFLFTACTEKETPGLANPLSATTWEAPDEIADVLYNGENLQYIEFIDAATVQTYKTNKGSIRAQQSGSYELAASTVTLLINGESKSFTLSGSLLVSTTQQTPSGGFLTYVKQ